MRGTPAQIIEKYNQLARDAQLANDRVAAENFQQHAEHYTRLLSEAQREMEARREQHEAQQRERQRERENERNARQQRDNQTAPVEAAQHAPAIDADPSHVPQPDIVDIPPVVEDSGLVDTPESRPKRQPRKPRARSKPSDKNTDKADAKPKPSATDAPVEKPDAPEAAE